MMIRAAFALSLALVAVPAFATDIPGQCLPKAKMRAVAAGQIGGEPKITFAPVASPTQTAFLKGVYVSNPKTPDGMPPGDGGAIYIIADGHKIAIGWSKGPLICYPLTVATPEIMGMLAAVDKPDGGADSEDDDTPPAKGGSHEDDGSN